MGAWIEIQASSLGLSLVCVAPRVGAWIEIDDKEKYYAGRGGRSPSGGRGLKFVPKRRGMFLRQRRSPYGSVD